MKMLKVNWYQIERFTTMNKWFWFVVLSVIIACFFRNPELSLKILLTCFIFGMAIALVWGVWGLIG